MAEYTTEHASQFAELDALLRAGILTPEEHAQARRKVAMKPGSRGGQVGSVNGIHVFRAPSAGNTYYGPSTGGSPSAVMRPDAGGQRQVGGVEAAPARVAPPRAPARARRSHDLPNGAVHHGGAPNGAVHPGGAPTVALHNGAAPNGAVHNGAGHNAAADNHAGSTSTVLTAPRPEPETTDGRPRAGGSRGRHSRRTPPQWPWVLIGLFVLVSVIVVSVAISRHHHAHPSGSSAAAPRPSTTAVPPNVVNGSQLEVPESINVNGADATVTVSKLHAVGGAADAPTVSYQATVSALGVYGSFPLDKTNFTALSDTGTTYHAHGGAQAPLVKTTVTEGRRVAGSIVFTVPKGQKLQTVLFTTSLGEQLGLWTAY